MGLLDCVASPEEKDYFDENERPFPRPRQLSKSDHDISRRRGLPLFSSQSNLKVVRDTDFWRTRVLKFLFYPEGRDDIRVLKVPFKQLGYQTVTDFIAEIPADQFNEFLPQTPVDDDIVKDDKVFWVHDGIAEPGTYKWQGTLDNVPIIGLQLDRKKAVPFRTYDGKGLFYCKPGHRALVPEDEVTPYKKFLRSYLGLPPRQDSLVGFRDSVRYSAKAIAAKNSKPGDRVYLPKEEKWALVQWIGKIDGETVVDLVYERPKSEAGKPISPDDPCISRSLSLADFIGELESVPNTPLAPPQEAPQLSTFSSTPSQAPAPPSQAPLSKKPSFSDQPPTPTSPLPDSSDGSSEDSETEESSEDDEGTEESESDEDIQSQSDSQRSLINDSETESVLDDRSPLSSPVEKLHPVVPNNEQQLHGPSAIEDDNTSPAIPSPKRKGFFGFSKNKKEKRFKASNLKSEKKSEFASLPEINVPSPPPRRNTGVFSSWRFKKGSKLNVESPVKEEVKETKSKEVKTPEVKQKSRLSSSWGALFKSKSKNQLHSLAFEDKQFYEECSTPIDEMIPPDNIPTPPPKDNKLEIFQERRIERPEIDLSPVAQRQGRVSESESHQEQVSSYPEQEDSSESDTTSESDEDEPTERENVAIHMHSPPESPTRFQSKPGNLAEIKVTTLEKEVVQPGPGFEKQEIIIDMRTSVKSNSPPPNDGIPDDDKPGFIDRFKESKLRTRPSSFGSFLARIKNLTPDSEVAKSAEATPPKATPQPETPKDPQEDTVITDRKDSTDSTTTSSSDQSDGLPSGPVEVTAEVQTQPANDSEGNQEEIQLDSLEVEEPNPINSPPPIPASEPPKRRQSRNGSFKFTFATGKRKSQPPTPTVTSPVPISSEDASVVNQLDCEEFVSEPKTETQPEEESVEKSSQKTSSFRNSFKRTFSFTRNKKRSSIDSEPQTPSSPATPSGNTGIGKPRPITMYNDENVVVERKGSLRKKRPTSLVVDIKPWNSRHVKSGSENSSPSSDDCPVTPGLKSPSNPALLPKQNVASVPKHRMFTTPYTFNIKSPKSPDKERLKAKNEYKRWSLTDPDIEVNVAPPLKSPIANLPAPVDPELEAENVATGKLKSALKQRKEIDSIPNGLKNGDRVLWYASGKGPVAGTVQRLFKDGTDKYTAMVKFDREVQEEPLRLVREGDAYIVTVEELITTNMFEPIYANQSELSSANIKPAGETPTPASPTVRFDGIAAEDPVPNVVVTSPTTTEVIEHDLPPPFQEEEVTMACGFRRGVQSRDKSCCLETILFSLFYTTNAFDITMLYANFPAEDYLTRNVRQILRKEIVDPLRREGFSPWYAVKKLRDAVKPLSDEWQTMSTDAEVMMFILFDRALKLQKFLSYSNNMSDFLHQLVVDPKDLAKSTTVQHLFETSLQMMEKIKLKTVPTPALILEMPRSNDKLMQYQAVIPNLTLTVSHILEGGPRLCICGAVAQYECLSCTANVGGSSIVYCENCRSTADAIHYQLPHETRLSPLSQSLIVLDLAAIICVKRGHYFSFVKCGKQQLSPWVFFDGAELDNPKVCIEQNLSMWLDRLEKYPGRYQDALQYPLLTHILQDSHICIYQPREKSSSV